MIGFSWLISSFKDSQLGSFLFRDSRRNCLLRDSDRALLTQHTVAQRQHLQPLMISKCSKSRCCLNMQALNMQAAYGRAGAFFLHCFVYDQEYLENLIWDQHAYCMSMYWKLSDGKLEEILLHLIYLLSAYH